MSTQWARHGARPGHVEAAEEVAVAHEAVDTDAQLQRRRLNLTAEFESSISHFSFQALSYRRFQRRFDRVNLHRPTQRLVAEEAYASILSGNSAFTTLPRATHSLCVST